MSIFNMMGLKLWRTKCCCAGVHQPRSSSASHVETRCILLLCPRARATFHTFWATVCSRQPATKMSAALTLPPAGDCGNPYVQQHVIATGFLHVPTCQLQLRQLTLENWNWVSKSKSI